MTDSPSSPAPTGDVVDATRRTRLASERTELAWWRTGLAALAVALAVGRVVPGLEDTPTRWPYTLVGICFAIYGIGLIAFGTIRRGAVERALAEGGFPEPSRLAHGTLIAGGLGLGLLTILLIAFG